MATPRQWNQASQRAGSGMPAIKSNGFLSGLGRVMQNAGKDFKDLANSSFGDAGKLGNKQPRTRGQGFPSHHSQQGRFMQAPVQGREIPGGGGH